MIPAEVLGELHRLAHAIVAGSAGAVQYQRFIRLTNQWAPVAGVDVADFRVALYEEGARS